MTAAELRSAPAPSLASRRSVEGGAAGTPTLFGHFARFNQWTEIDSVFEGRFMERVAPGAFARTLAHDRNRLRVLFQHGRDPQIGDKPLGVPTLLREDEIGAKYEVPLLDTSYVQDLIPGLRAGVYGASFRFKVLREDFDQQPTASAYNPQALPERTIREAQLLEFGPVTFPAYEGATAAVRSLTDWWLTAVAAEGAEPPRFPRPPSRKPREVAGPRTEARPPAPQCACIQATTGGGAATGHRSDVPTPPVGISLRKVF